MNVLLIPALIIIALESAVIILMLFLQKNEKAKETRLIDEREMLYKLMDNLHEAVYFKDRNSKFIRGNLIDAQLHGFANADELIGKDDFYIHDREKAEQFYKEEQELMQKDISIIDREAVISSPEGKDLWVRYSKIPVKSNSGKVIGLFGLAQDITERKKADELRSKYQEKLEVDVAERTERLNILLHEIHHRVKNNLQMISGLLSLEMVEINDIKSRNCIDKSLSRINTIASVHEMLYDDRPVKAITIKEFFERLPGISFSSFNNLNPELQLDIKGDSPLAYDTATPLALIFNEFLTASLESLDGKDGKITISVKPQAEGEYLMEFNNSSKAVNKLSGLSETLVTELAKQIGARVEKIDPKRTTLALCFHPDKNKTGGKDFYSGD